MISFLTGFISFANEIFIVKKYFMKLKEALPLFDSAIILEIANNREMYDSKSAIPESRMNYVVTAIKPENTSILIVLTDPPKTKTLEELGYSFESGM